MRIIAAALAILLALLGPALAQKVTLAGEVTYRERIALPANGTLTVSLIDLAMPDVPRILARANISGPGQVPLTFALSFDQSIVLPAHDYALRAELSDADGAIWFRNAEPYPVAPLAPDGPILIVMNRAPAPEPAAEPEPEPDATEAPVEEAAIAPAEPMPPPPILEVTWRAVSIAGAPADEKVVSSLSIAPDMRAGGKGGCNSWFAQAEVGQTTLMFSAVAATRMACLSEVATAQEDAFFAALSATRAWRLDGERLALLDAGGRELAVLQKSAF